MRNLKMESTHQYIWRDFSGINDLLEHLQHAGKIFSLGLFTDQEIKRGVSFCLLVKYLKEFTHLTPGKQDVVCFGSEVSVCGHCRL